MLLLLLKADTLPQGHQMLLLSAVRSSDEQTLPGAGKQPKTGNAVGAWSSREDKPTRGHVDWLSITQLAPKREEIRKGRPEQCMAEHFQG